MSSTVRTSLGWACLIPSYTSRDTKIPAPSLKIVNYKLDGRRVYMTDCYNTVLMYNSKYYTCKKIRVEGFVLL